MNHLFDNIEPKNDPKYHSYKKFMIYYADAIKHDKLDVIWRDDFDNYFRSYIGFSYSFCKVYKYNELCLECIKYNPNLLRYINFDAFIYTQQSYKLLCLEACQIDGMVLKFVRPNNSPFDGFFDGKKIYSRSDYNDICNEAIKQNPMSKKYITNYIECYKNGHINNIANDTCYNKYYKNGYKLCNKSFDMFGNCLVSVFLKKFSKIYYKNKIILFL